MTIQRFLVSVLGVFLLVQSVPASAQATTPQFQQLYSVPDTAGISAMAVDPAGNIYLAGTGSFPTTPGVVQPVFGGGTCITIGFMSVTYPPCPDVVVIKLDPTGKVIYATYLGGNQYDSVVSIAADAAGNAYVIGSTYSSNFPTTPGAAFPTYTTGSAFIAKLNPQGTALIYSTLLPNVADGAAIVDSTGAVYFTGWANLNASGLLFPTTAGAFQTQLPSQSTVALVAKLNPAGSAFVYATYLGPTGTHAQSDGLAIAVDSSGNAYITGNSGAGFPVTPGALQSSLPSVGSSIFMAKLNPGGTALTYGTYFGGSQGDSPTAIRVDSQGNTVVLGLARSSDFPVTANALQPAGPAAPWNGLNSNVAALGGNFLSKLNAQGTALVYSSYLEGATAVDVDAAGNIYVAGSAGLGFPTTGGAYQRCVGASDENIFVAEFDPNGNLLGATYVGGDATASALPSIFAAGIVAAGNGSVYLLGSSLNTPPLGQPYVNNPTQFVAKLLINDPQKTPVPCLTGFVENAASFQPGSVVAGEMVTLHGIGMATDQGSVATVNGSVPNQLAGAQVLFDGIPAPLLYAQSQQINAVVPWGIAGQTQTQVQVRYGGLSSNVAAVPVTASQPGLFRANYTTSQGAILNADGSVNSAANPAARGSIVALWGTGGGPMSQAGVDGGIWPLNPLASLQLPVTATISGQNANVIYAGAAPGLVSGFFQINLQVPANAFSGANPVAITIGGTPLPNSITAPTTVAVK